MALRFLADHCIPNSIVRRLQQAGHEASRLRNLAALSSADTVVIDTVTV